MRNFTLLTLLLFPNFANSQSSPARVIGSFLYKNAVYNYDFTRDDQNSYALFITRINYKEKDSINTTTSVKPQDSESEKKIEPMLKTTSDMAQIVISKGDKQSLVNQKDSTFFSEFSKDIFDIIFKNQMKGKFNAVDGQALQEKSSEVFFTIKTRLDFIEDEPTTAYMILKKDGIFSFLKENSAEYYKGRLSNLFVYHLIHKTSVEIDEGTIKNIKVQLLDPSSPVSETVSPRRYLEFKNQYPISISGKFDPDKFAGVNMYCANCYGIFGLSRFIKLSDLLTYDIVLENEKEDYSPANKVVSLAPNNPIVELRKEKRSKILDVSAYTDFVGLDQQQPNGLIQFEVKRKIIINSRHRLIGQRRKADGTGKITMEEFVRRYDLSGLDAYHLIQTKDTKGDAKFQFKESENNSSSTKSTKMDNEIVIRQDKFMPINFVWFNNVEFKLQFLKLEENNRILPYERLGILPDSRNIHPIDLYKYQINAFGPTFDFVRVNYTQLKFSWNVLNIGINWFNVRVADSTVSVSETGSNYLNNFSFQPGTSFTFRPDSRWGITLGVNYFQQSTWSKNYELWNPHGLLQYHVNANLKTNEHSRLFFRFRFTHEIKERYENFTQIQAGYTVDIFNTISRSDK